MAPDHTTLELARAAYERHDWPRARELFRAARARGELPADGLYALSDAAWWLGDDEECLEACGGAYHLYLKEDQPRRAALAAVDLAMVFFLRGESTLGSGWMSRARRLLDDQPEAAEHGYVLYLLEVEGPLGGVVPSDPIALSSLLAAARRVQEIGRQHGDPSLRAVGIVGEGARWSRRGAWRKG